MSTNNFPCNGSPAACEIPSILTNSLAASKKQPIQPQMTLDSAFCMKPRLVPSLCLDTIGALAAETPTSPKSDFLTFPG